MKYCLYFVAIIFFTRSGDFTPLLADDAPSSPEYLCEKLGSALKSKNTNEVMALFNSEGETNEWRGSSIMREMLVKAETSALLRASNFVVRIGPMPAKFPIPNTNVLNGISTKFNVTISGVVEVKSQNGGIQQWPYGKRVDGFYLAGITLEKIPGRNLAIRVMAGPNTDLLTYTGRWVYVRNGQNINVDTSDKTNRFLEAWGDYIESCEIRRTSTNEMTGFANWFYFQVNEGGTNVFESPELTNEDLFIYHRK